MKPRGQFTITKIQVNGETRWQVSGTKRDGERVRKRFNTEAEAEGEAQVLQIETVNSFTDEKPVMTWLSPEQVQEAESCFRELGEKSMSKAMRYFLDTYREPVTEKVISEAFDEFFAFKKTTKKRSKRTLEKINSRVGSFVRQHSSKAVSHITTPDVQQYCAKGGALNQNSNRAELRAFFNWCKDKGYCLTNPALGVEEVSRDHSDIKALSVAQVQTLLKIAGAYKAEQGSAANNGGLIPFIALAVFAGLRPQEIESITWQHIDIENRNIIVGSGTAKTRQRRVVEISDNLAAWLATFKAKKSPIFWSRLPEHFDRIKEAAKFRPMEKAGQVIPEDKKNWTPWVQDYLRHTAISNHYAHHKNEAATAAWAGNSPDVIHRHYRALTTPQEAKAFWAIMPPSTKGKIIKLKAA